MNLKKERTADVYNHANKMKLHEINPFRAHP